MNLETGKQALMDQLSEAYFSAIELKSIWLNWKLIRKASI